MIEGKGSKTFKGTLKYGMVGGGRDSFIGEVHRKAAKFDGKIELIAGCFSRSYENTLETGVGLGLVKDRLYQDYTEMAVKESQREDCIDFVSIVTPNYAHYSAAKAFLENGISVVCEKPLTIELDEAEELAKLARKNGLLFCISYSYTGYPMVKHAREMVKNGDIGEITMVMGEYPQDWLATPLEKEGQKQAAWRTDPKTSGKSNCNGDIGSHIENVVSYISGLEIESLAAKLDILGEERELDTNASIMIKYTNGATGLYWSSQVAIGYDNALKIRIFGTKGSIEWEQESCNYLKVAYPGKPVQTLSRGRDQLYPLGGELSRIPAGHPEGYYEAFANIYSNFANALLALKEGKEVDSEKFDYPSLADGISGVRFIGKSVESSKSGASWIPFK